jgi:hypothetical protein
MDGDLLAVARTLAERDCLYPIFFDGVMVRISAFPNSTDFPICESSVEATEADIHLAAHKEIIRRGWGHECRPLRNRTAVLTSGTKCLSLEEPGTTTLSLLHALLAAIEAAS